MSPSRFPIRWNHWLLFGDTLNPLESRSAWGHRDVGSSLSPLEFHSLRLLSGPLALWSVHWKYILTPKSLFQIRLLKHDFCPWNIPKWTMNGNSGVIHYQSASGAKWVNSMELNVGTPWNASFAGLGLAAFGQWQRFRAHKLQLNWEHSGKCAAGRTFNLKVSDQRSNKSCSAHNWCWSISIILFQLIGNSALPSTSLTSNVEWID